MFLRWCTLNWNCTIGKKKRSIPNYFNTIYRTEMKLVPLIMDYGLLQFNGLKFFLGVRLHGGFLPDFNFFNVNPHIFQRNLKAHLANCLETNFHNIFNISLRVFRRRNYSECENLRGKIFFLNISGVDKSNIFFI